MKKDKKKPYVQPEVKVVQQPEPKETPPAAIDEGNWISAIGGRKFVLILITMFGVVIVGCVRGDLKTEEITDTLMWLAAIGAGSIALEDGLGRVAKRKG